MADVNITINDETKTSFENQNENFLKGLVMPQIPNLPLDQLGYPKAHEWIQHRKANIRPWSVFLNTSNFRGPPSIQRLGRRFMKNIEYFQSNYLFVFIGLIIYCLITSPLLLLTVIACLTLCYKVSQRNNTQELYFFKLKLTLVQVYTIIAFCSLPLFYLVGAGAALFWVLGVSWLLITIHAAYYNIDSILCPGEDELNSLIMQEV